MHDIYLMAIRWLFVYRNTIEERIGVLSVMWVVKVETKTFAEV